MSERRYGVAELTVAKWRMHTDTLTVCNGGGEQQDTGDSW